MIPLTGRNERARAYPCPRCGVKAGEKCLRVGRRAKLSRGENSGCHEARRALAEFRGRGPGGHTVLSLDTDNGVFAITCPGSGTSKADLIRILEVVDEIAAGIRHEIGNRARIEEQELLVLNTTERPRNL
jgi:hypothetical protein